MRETTAIFLHIPKTAGTTLRKMLRRNYPRREIFHVRRIESARYYFTLLDFLSRLRRFGLVMGHFGYGVHRYVHGETRYFTVLRDPVQRVISEYYFCLRKWNHRLHRTVVSRRMSLEEFIDAPIDSTMYNCQTRMLSATDGRYSQAYAGGDVGEKELAMAQRNLAENMAVVGLTERFDETLLLCRQAFGWRDIRYTSEKVAANKRKDLPERVLARIRENNRYDLALHAFARGLLDKQIAGYPGDFQRDLDEFRAQNAVYVSPPIRR